MTIDEMHFAIKNIISSGLGFEAIELLEKQLKKQYNSILYELADKNATLTVIKKINCGKNEAINALIE